MINYTSDLMAVIKKVANKVLVTTTYPDTNIVPIVILYESDQSLIFKCNEYEHASSTIVIEIYAKDIPSRNQLRTNIDAEMQGLHFELVKKEDIDNDPVYVSKMTYQCELIQRGNSVKIYNKK
jgi:hypothetical protein